MRSSSSMTSRSSGSARRVASDDLASSRAAARRTRRRSAPAAWRSPSRAGGRRRRPAAADRRATRFTRTPEASSSPRTTSTARLASSLMSCQRRLSDEVSVNASRLRTMPTARVAFSWISRSSSVESSRRPAGREHQLGIADHALQRALQFLREARHQLADVCELFLLADLNRRRPQSARAAPANARRHISSRATSSAASADDHDDSLQCPSAVVVRRASFGFQFLEVRAHVFLRRRHQRRRETIIDGFGDRLHGGVRRPRAPRAPGARAAAGARGSR